jgi:hypothetical protein
MAKLIFKKQKGQALLIVLVISTLALLILLGISSRISLSKENVIRSNSYNLALADAEDALSDVNRIIDMRLDCTLPTSNTEYTLMQCRDNNLLKNAFVYIKASNDNKIATNPKTPISLFVTGSSTTPVSTKGVKILCKNNSLSHKMIVSRVYFDSAINQYGIDKGTLNCQQANNDYPNPAFSLGNVTFYSESSSTPLPYGTIRNDTKMIRVRMLDVSTGTVDNEISIETIGTNNLVVAATGKYEGLIYGQQSANAEGAVTFQKPREDYYVPAAFDFVYFGEDRN